MNVEDVLKILYVIYLIFYRTFSLYKIIYNVFHNSKVDLTVKDFKHFFMNFYFLYLYIMNVQVVYVFFNNYYTEVIMKAIDFYELVGSIMFFENCYLVNLKYVHYYNIQVLIHLVNF